jgi:ssRNA-specific RNase YbeY (16S rRNA maturation enzyme)
MSIAYSKAVFIISVIKTNEIATLLVHGTLHVLGYDHETDAGEMIARQGRILDDASWELLLGQV